MKKIILEDDLLKIQNLMNKKIIFDNYINIKTLNIITGVDLAYWTENNIEYAVCCLVTIDYKTKQILEKSEYVGEVKFPYIAGYLAFREFPLFYEAFKKLKIAPQLLIFDGNGYLHPRNMGIATYAGINIGKPTIGVAKSYYKISNMDYIMPKDKIASYTNIIIENKIYGRALRTKNKTKPIFVSIGNMIDIDTATTVIKNLISEQSHIPIPTRLADIDTHLKRKLYKSAL